MVWRPGQSGNPTGRKAGMTNQNGARIRAAFVRLFDADPSKLDKMALACWEKAVAGDVPAQTFIRDTIDGRPLQRNDVGDARPLLIVSGVIRALPTAAAGMIEHNGDAAAADADAAAEDVLGGDVLGGAEGR